MIELLTISNPSEFLSINGKDVSYRLTVIIESWSEEEDADRWRAVKTMLNLRDDDPTVTQCLATAVTDDEK